jgi:hypothetical protein
MRILPLVLLFLASGVLAAEGPDTLETVQRITRSGALQLALNRVEQSQPRDTTAPRWAEWEALRLALLSQFQRHADVLRRAGALPADMPPSQLRECLTFAVRAAVATAQAGLARQYAARVLWQLNPSADEVKAIRLLVIESYAAEQKGDEAFRSMLRFQQDYQPLDRDTATRFVAALLELGLAREAVNWLASLDEASAVKLLLRLKTGLVSADAAITQARAMLVKGNNAGYWQVITHVAAQQKDRALQIESLENMLHLASGRDAQRLAAQARDLWQVYFAVAQEAGNRNQLLAGDDTNWADFAARRLGKDPSLARAFFAYLAQRAQTRDARHGAQLQLVFSLRTSKLELAALRLFQDADLEGDAIDLRTRYFLGAIAEAHELPGVALHFWQGLPAPPDATEDEWRLRVATVALRDGMLDHSAALLKGVVGAKQALTAQLAQRSVALVQEILDAGKFDLAGELFEALLPLVDTAQRRAVLFGLGRIHEVRGQSPVAADYYLRSALLSDGPVPDALALQARLLAALNLSRAGYKDDARTQFDWLVKNSKDAGQLELARRELRKP